MADFNKGNATDLKNNTAQYAEGSYVSADKILVVGQSSGAFGSKNDKKVTIRTVTAWTKKDSKVQSSTTVIYALDNKNDKWQPVGITDDGGTTIKLSGDDRYPLVGDNDDLKNNFTYYEELTEGLQDTQDRSGLGIKNNVYNSIDESTLNGSGEGGTLVDNVLVNMSDSESSKIRAGFRGRGRGESDPAEQDGSRPVPNPPRSSTNQIFSSPIFSSQGLSYPIDLDLNTQDALKITIHQRKPREFSGGQRNESSFDRGVNNADGSERALATIYLPVSGNISDSNNVDYNSNSLNFLQGFAIQQISKSIKGGLGQDEGIAANLNKAFGQIGEQNIPVKNLIGDYTAATALKGLVGQSVNNIQSRFSGQILNPNMELLFNGPKLRNFQFQYRLTPRERDESVRIQQIITAIKRHMSPKRGKNGGFFLGAPDFFRLQYLYRNENHKFLNKFKDCALIGFDVNYAPEGTYATYPDGGMHSYLMTMRFAELDPIYFEDYAQSDAEDPIGTSFGGIGF